MASMEDLFILSVPRLVLPPVGTFRFEESNFTDSSLHLLLVLLCVAVVLCYSLCLVNLHAGSR